jgi:hypothetical protein
LKSVDSFKQTALEVICCFDLNCQVYLKFDYVRIGSSSGWGGEASKPLTRISGKWVFFCASPDALTASVTGQDAVRKRQHFWPVLDEKSFLIQLLKTEQ